jgi:hypothetical protein
VLIDGYRRMAALRRLGHDTVRAECRGGPLGEALPQVLARSRGRSHHGRRLDHQHRPAVGRSRSQARRGAPVIGAYAKRIREYNAEDVDRMLDQLLQDPAALGPQLRALIDSGAAPITQRQLLGQALRGTAQSASAGATTP